MGVYDDVITGNPRGRSVKGSTKPKKGSTSMAGGIGYGTIKGSSGSPKPKASGGSKAAKPGTKAGPKGSMAQKATRSGVPKGKARTQAKKGKSTFPQARTAKGK